MKKCSFILILFLTLTLASCSQKKSTETSGDFDRLRNDYETLHNDYQKLNNDYETEKTTLADQKSQYDQLKSDYDNYREKMKPYETLSEEEAKAKEVEAQKKLDKEAADKKAKEQAQKEKAEKEAKKGYDTGITYDQIARTPDEFKDQKVKFTGTVIQVMELENQVEIRLSIDNKSDSVLYCSYDKSIISSRILENDKITIYGTYNGLITYQSTLGQNITIPYVIVDKIDLKK